MNGRTQLLNVEKSIKENKDMLDEINLRRSKDTGDELSIANHTKNENLSRALCTLYKNARDVGFNQKKKY